MELKNIVAVHSLADSSYRPGFLRSAVAFTMGAVLRTSVIHRGPRAISVPVPAEWPVIALRKANLPVPQDKDFNRA